MIRRLAEREQNILMVTLSVVIFVVVHNTIVGPLLKKMELLDQEIKRLEAQWRQERALAARARTIDAKFEAYSNQFGRFETRQEVVSAALSEIESVGRKFGVQVIDLKLGASLKGGYGEQFSLSVTSNSEMLKVIRFLYELQQSPYFFNVESLVFEKSSRNDIAPLTSRLVLTKAFIFSTGGQAHE